MPAKRNVADLLDDAPHRTPLRRGRGFQLSTETTAEAQSPSEESSPSVSRNRNIEKSRNRETVSAKPRRIKRGYELREDLVRACKMIAAQEDRKIYEVMEEALEQYLEQRQLHKS
jgi:undecaprenyl pyrophosphate synthase